MCEEYAHLLELKIDSMLAYPEFDLTFDDYTNASEHQLRAVMAQQNCAIAVFNRKCSGLQTKYTISELTCFDVVGTLIEFSII